MYIFARLIVNVPDHSSIRFAPIRPTVRAHVYLGLHVSTLRSRHRVQISIGGGSTVLLCSIGHFGDTVLYLL